MLRKLLLALLAFGLVGALTFLVGWAVGQPTTALPERITAATVCPVAGCAQADSCHAATPAPVPDGSFEMLCPRTEGCADVECHAWDRIETTRGRPSDASLNLWILAPVVLVVGLVLLIRKL
ncbi:MAG: hypothetical protein LBK67_05860 [Coriobacteriales bacterium]|jgi:hypothetical protein|nr:hypothetical protein [Coriobacteriales bacterium]